MATIESLIGKFAEKGIAHPNRYKVVIPGLRDGDVYCQATNLPGRQITTGERSIGMITQKMPNGFIFDDVNLTFLLDGEYSVRKYFDEWHYDIIGTQNYELKYKNTMTKTVEIHQLDKETEETIYGVKLLKAFPITVNPIELGNDLVNQITQLNVQLNFVDWEPLETSRSGSSGGKNIAQPGVGIPEPGVGVPSIPDFIPRPRPINDVDPPTRGPQIPQYWPTSTVTEYIP